jgi:hypothetical protein
MEQAGAIGASLLRRSLPGKRSNITRRCQIASIIVELIWQRFHVGPYQWKLKHCIWYLDIGSSNLSHSRKYQHWLVLRELLYALKQHEWVVALAQRGNATYVRPSAKIGALKVGRPANLP